MNRKSLSIIVTLVVSAVMLLSACGPAATPAPTEVPAVPTQAPAPTQAAAEVPTAAPTTAPTAAGPCLIVGALYGGPMNDAGYNQAMHEAVQAIKTKIDCVKIIEAENVPDEAGATSTMENMIQQGAKLIIPTAYNMQDPAFALAKKYPDVKFEHAGGWEMSDNFANFFGNPPEGWYLMGQAAGKMTKSNKLGFVAAFPLGWTNTFINAFELGAKSVNPKAETTVAYTFAWGDRAKEADTTNALINQGADVITMHVDSPSTIISTAEQRGAYSIGFQNVAAQQFAPQYWISGTGFTLGDKLAWLASTVIDGTWKPIFLRCGIADGCMTIAPWGPTVPQEVKDLVAKTQADIESGKTVIFQGPIKDQTGAVKVKAGETISDNDLGNVDWFVQGVNGSPK
jgi:basic membrane protein A and related proteins